MQILSGKPIRWSWRFRTARRGHAFRHGFAFTLGGATYILVCLMVGLAAANNQINPLFLIFGILLGGLLVSGVVSTLTLSGLRAIRRLPPSAMVGQAVLLVYEVTNSKRWLSSYSLHVREYRPPARCGEAYLPVVSPAARAARAARAPQQPARLAAAPGSPGVGCQPALLLCDRRGIYRLQALTVFTRFPFSLFVHFARFKVFDELVVYPALGRLTHDALSLIGRGAGAGQQALSRAGGQDEFYGLREYREGDNPRWIHWRRSAGLGTLVLREMSPLTPRRLIVMLSICRPPDRQGGQESAGQPDHVELTLALAATLLNDAIRRGLDVGLLIAHGDCDGDQRWFPPARGRRSWLSMMRALASLAPAETVRAAPSFTIGADSPAGEPGQPGQPPAATNVDLARQLGRAQCLWITAGLPDADIREQLAELANWNISVRLLQAERTDLSRLIVLPAPATPG